MPRFDDDPSYLLVEDPSFRTQDYNEAVVKGEEVRCLPVVVKDPSLDENLHEEGYLPVNGTEVVNESKHKVPLLGERV